MVDLSFHKKPDAELNKFAADLLGMHDAHAIAEKLNQSKFNVPAVIRQMEAQESNLGENLPPLVITGLAEHMAQEARDRKSIAAEYDAMKNLADKQGVAHELEKVRGLVIREASDRTLQTVDVKTSDTVTQNVYQASDAGQKAKDAGRKVQDEGKRVINKLNPFGH
jgi:hypothetical protein